MAGTSDIEWTDATWNPFRGCRKISPGCKHCYAETFAERFRGVPKHPYERGFDPRFVPEALSAPLRWRKGKRIFVNSMSDLFLDDFTDEQIDRVFAVMQACPHHTFQVLTKRAERMVRYFRSGSNGKDASERVADAGEDIAAEHGWCHAHEGEAWPLPNVWLGVSVENADYHDRIEALRRVPAAVRFVSFEPLLGDMGRVNLSGIHWAIVGGESGHRRRPMEETWVRSLRDQCAEAGTTFFYKQAIEAKKVVSLPLIDGVRHAAFPEVG